MWLVRSDRENLPEGRCLEIIQMFKLVRFRFARFGPVGACIPTLRRTFLGYGVVSQSGAISSAFVEGTDIQLNIVIYI